MNNQIDHAEQTADGITMIHKGDQDDNFSVETLRGGILWPCATSNGYLCIIGQFAKHNKNKRKPLILLAEHEKILPKDLVKTICAETRRLMCRTFFCDFNNDTFGFMDELDKYIIRYKFGNVSLDPPYLVDWINGVLSMQQWAADESVKIPTGTTMGKQMGRIAIEDRDESRRGPFYAIDALRCVIGSFEKPAERPMTIKKARYLYA